MAGQSPTRRSRSGLLRRTGVVVDHGGLSVLSLMLCSGCGVSSGIYYLDSGWPHVSIHTQNFAIYSFYMQRAVHNQIR